MNRRSLLRVLLLAGACALSGGLAGLAVVTIKESFWFAPGLSFGALVLPVLFPLRQLLFLTLASTAVYALAIGAGTLVEAVALLKPATVYVFGGSGALLLGFALRLKSLVRLDWRWGLALAAAGAVLMEAGHLAGQAGLLEGSGRAAARIAWSIFVWQLGVALLLRRLAVDADAVGR